MKTGKRVLVLAIELLLLAIVWDLAGRVFHLFYLPPPMSILYSLITELPGDLGLHLLTSTIRVLASTVLSLLIAVPLAFLTVRSSLLDEMLTPLAYLIYPIPKIVLLPLILLLFGLGESSKVAMLVLVISFQLFVVVRDAVHRVRPETLDSVRSLGATRWQILYYVYLPASFPAVLTALKISTGTAIAVLFIVESFATRAGLGYYIMVETWGRMAYARMYGGILAMGLLGLLLYGLIGYVERRLCKWA